MQPRILSIILTDLTDPIILLQIVMLPLDRIITAGSFLQAPQKLLILLRHPIHLLQPRYPIQRVRRRRIRQLDLTRIMPRLQQINRQHFLQ